MVKNICLQIPNISAGQAWPRVSRMQSGLKVLGPRADNLCVSPVYFYIHM